MRLLIAQRHDYITCHTGHVISGFQEGDVRPHAAKRHDHVTSHTDQVISGGNMRLLVAQRHDHLPHRLSDLGGCASPMWLAAIMTSHGCLLTQSCPATRSSTARCQKPVRKSLSRLSRQQGSRTPDGAPNAAASLLRTPSASSFAQSMKYRAYSNMSMPCSAGNVPTCIQVLIWHMRRPFNLNPLQHHNECNI